MRLCEALAVAENRTPVWTWSPRIRWRAGVLEAAHPEVGIKQIFDILENPIWAGAHKGTTRNSKGRVTVGGPRPCRAGETRSEGQDIPQLNTSNGKRIGDAIWRAQMRSQIGNKRHAGEVMIDLLKAFEYVSRERLAGRGARGDYPTHVIAAGLATYGFKRRLVYKV